MPRQEDKTHTQGL